MKTLLFLALFVGCTVGALFAPAWGVFGYMGHYMIGPERQWWHAPLSHHEIRYSFILALIVAVSLVFHWRQVRARGKNLFTGHEWLMLLFLGIVWATVILGPKTDPKYYSVIDHPSVKMTKAIFFTMLLTHVITNLKLMSRLLWVFVLGAMVLGLQAYAKPLSSFTAGRLETVGGADFANSNHLGGFLAALLYIIGAQFMRSGWKGRILCFLAGGFAANAIILTRSRGALLGLAAGALVAIILVPRKHRFVMIAGLLLAMVGILSLTDTSFRSRATTITAESHDRDTSAQSRLEIWRGAWKMIREHPLGVGAGNFYQNIDDYVPEHAGMDAHNTVLRVTAELGWLGLMIFLVLVVNSLRILSNTVRLSQNVVCKDRQQLLWMCCGVGPALAALFAYGLTGTLVYIEYFWWIIALPVCLQVISNRMLASGETPPAASRNVIPVERAHRQPALAQRGAP